MEKPLRRRLFVFTVKERQRLPDGSRFYVPDSRRGMLTRAEDVWILSSAEDCVIEKWKKGMHCLIADGFELEPYSLPFWEKHENDLELSGLKSFAERVEGKIECMIVHEESILAEVEGELYQSDPQW